MITEALLEAAARVLGSLVVLMPETEIDTESFTEFGMNIGSAAMAFNEYIPVGAMFGAAAMLIAVWVVMAAWNGLAWVYHQFWGSS